MTRFLTNEITSDKFIKFTEKRVAVKMGNKNTALSINRVRMKPESQKEYKEGVVSKIILLRKM